jgi:hypothetical protein
MTQPYQRAAGMKQINLTIGLLPSIENPGAAQKNNKGVKLK